MKILDSLLFTLDCGGVAVRDIRQGPFQTAVLTRNCGLASTLQLHGYRHGEPAIVDAGLLIEKSVQELVRLAYSQQPLEAAIGMATINSLIDVDESRCVSLNARDLLIEKGRGKKVDSSGISPLCLNYEKKQKRSGSLSSIRRKMTCLREWLTLSSRKLMVVGITGFAFINHTIE